MIIPPLGKLNVSKECASWLVSSPVAIDLLDGKEMLFTFDGLTNADVADVSRAVSAFLKLGRKEREEASLPIFANYQRMADLMDEEDLGCQASSPSEIWAHVRPTAIYVERESSDGKIYVSVAANCAWEREHGLQLVYRDGHLLSRVSEQDGHLI